MTDMVIDPRGGLHSVPGFLFSGIRVGSGDKKNLGIVFSEVPDTIGTAVYTRNDVKAAPVLISQRHDAVSPIKRAVMINSGRANAFTGKKGIDDALACADKLAAAIGVEAAHIYLGSTGAIGYPLPLGEILAGIEPLVGASGKTERAAQDFVEAIMTTDTRPKHAGIRYVDHGREIHIGAAVKGAGMIMPNMATMLCTVATDADIDIAMLNGALIEAADQSFNCATVDGDTSTNDTIFALANGLAGNPRITERNNSYRLFSLHLTALLEHLAKEMIGDGEGITKFITIHVRGVPREDQGRAIAFSIANSPLVKTALFGEQMNWGRIMMAAGKAYTGLDFNRLNLSINSIEILHQGELVSAAALERAGKSIAARDIVIDLDLCQGRKRFTAWTCDFSYDYVKINAGYLS